MWTLLAPLFWKLLPIVLGELGKFLLDLIQKAKPLVEQAAKDQSLPDGAARHEWIKGQILPAAKASASTLLEAIKTGLVDVAIKIGYDQLQKKLK